MKFSLIIIIGLMMIGCEKISYLPFNNSLHINDTQNSSTIIPSNKSNKNKSNNVLENEKIKNESTNFLFENDFTNRFFCMEDTCIKKIEVLNIINKQPFKVKNKEIELIYNGSCYDTTTTKMTTDDNGNIFIVNGYVKLPPL